MKPDYGGKYRSGSYLFFSSEFFRIPICLSSPVRNSTSAAGFTPMAICFAAGTGGTTGTQAFSNNGYIFYFSDRRGNRDGSGNETGEFGFEDVVNAAATDGLPNGTLDTGEDFNGNGTLDTYGANLPYSPYAAGNDLYNTTIPKPVAATALDVAEPLDTTETSIDIGFTNIAPAVPGYYRIDNEIVNCTALSGKTLTCTRGQMGTTAAAHTAVRLDLAEDLDTTETGIDVVDPNVVSVPAFYRVDDELMYCTALSGVTVTCERGRLGTMAAAHNMRHTYLSANITSTTATSIGVNSTTSFPAGYYRLENEIMNCTVTNSTTLTCTRGVLDTTAATHNQNATTLTAAITLTTSTDFPVASGAALTVVPGNYRIDNEVIRCTAVVSNTATCDRGQMGTTAATHVINSNVRPVLELVSMGKVNLFTSQRAMKNRQHYFRRALRLVNGANTSTVNNLPTPGFTVASENPVYVMGNYNAYTGSTGFNGPHSYCAVIADAVTFLSNAYNDNNSFQYPYTLGSPRTRTETNFRIAVAAGKGINFPQPLNATATPDFGTDGGTYNFLRFLETGGANIWYRGSIVSLFYYRQATGTYKCCNAVYGAPTRQYAFDTDFLVPSQLPPGTPRFRDVNNLSFRQTIRADSN